MKELHKKLLKVQSELKAPKGQLNKFGNYRYRSQEDILEAVKPLLAENELLMTISDNIVNADGRFYIEATVRVSHGDDEVVVTAYAREAETKKGMDESQITGTASSYARKYALNALYLIDDTKDADTMDNSSPATKVAPKKVEKKVTPEQVEDIKLFIEENESVLTNEVVSKALAWASNGKTELKEFTNSEYLKLCAGLKAKINQG